MENKTKVYLIGNAHLDPVWLWRWQEGYAEIKATFRSALDRMKEFPEFIFTCAGAAYYKWVEENCPEMFEEIKERVKEGRWVIVGGWWIQPDCNIPSGESFVRQGLYSQRYFLNKFGLAAKVGYNVDSFGHNGNLPQILKKSGMDYYIFMRPGDHEKKLPGNLFFWKSNDGSEVLAFKIPFSYGNWWQSEGDPFEEKLDNVIKLADQQGYDFMNFYGVGNHGGGPTVANLLSIRRLMTKLGEDKIIVSSPNKYFEDISVQDKDFPVVHDDLQHHASGCYSAHSHIKKYNRKAENRLITAEKFATIAYKLLGLHCPNSKLQAGWEKVMFNQFHDILGGCSIKEAYDDALESYGAALNESAEVLNASIQKISWSIDTSNGEEQCLSKDMDWALWEKCNKGVPIVVFNPLSWSVTMPIQANKKVNSIKDSNGKTMQTQYVRASQTNVDDKWDTLFIGDIPPMGYKVYWLYKEKDFSIPDCKRKDTYIENDWLRLEIEPHTGYVSRLYDKISKVEILNGKAAVPIVIDEYGSDTWSHGIFEFRNEIGKFCDAQVCLIEDGPIRARIRVTNRYNASILRQDFIMYRDKKDIEVHVKLDWREKHKMLKLSFPVNVIDPKSTCEIPYGYIEKPINGEEEPAQNWIDITGKYSDNDHEVYGLSILNDGKYSFDIKDNDMRMTVVRSPIYADHFGKRDGLCEYMDQGIQEFKYMIVPHKGDWRDGEVVKKAYELNCPPEYIIETYHKGTLPLEMSGIIVSETNIISTVFKIGEDGDGFILRCYETSGKDTYASFKLPLLNRSWEAKFEACEIKTFKIPTDDNLPVIETNLLEIY